MLVDYEKDLEARCEHLENLLQEQSQAYSEALKKVYMILGTNHFYTVTFYSDQKTMKHYSEKLPKMFKNPCHFAETSYTTFLFDSAVCYIKSNERLGCAVYKNRMWVISSEISSLGNTIVCNDGDEFPAELISYPFKGDILISSDLQEIVMNCWIAGNNNNGLNILENRIREIFSMTDEEVSTIWNKEVEFLEALKSL